MYSSFLFCDGYILNELKQEHSTAITIKPLRLKYMIHGFISSPQVQVFFIIVNDGLSFFQNIGTDNSINGIRLMIG